MTLLMNAPIHHPKRYITNSVRNDLKSKMVFVGGPRQVGKTTFALTYLKNETPEHPAYFNWDFAGTHQKLVAGELPRSEPLIVLDEIHKYARWRNLLKGFYDRYHHRQAYLVTGSARLDYYRKGGDSLQGRYHYYRLHPFSVLELNSRPTNSDLEHLLRFGGFPEPLFVANETHWRRWRAERVKRVIQDDLRDLEKVKEVSLIELLIEALPARVGSPLSVKNLREDLQVAHESVARWLQILENLYVCFRIPPFGSPKIRAVKKEQKLYLWDWSQIPNEGAKFENLVASQLLKFCHFKEDTEGFLMELRFIRDTDKREVDFVVLKDRKPLFAVECKSGESARAPNISYFKDRTAIPAFYQVHRGNKDSGDETKEGRILPFTTFCRELGMP